MSDLKYLNNVNIALNLLAEDGRKKNAFITP